MLEKRYKLLKSKGGKHMTLKIITYDNKVKLLENVIGFEFDGETGMLKYIDNVSIHNFRIENKVKEVNTL